MSSILGQCYECCSCPAPTVESRSRSISIRKGGLNLFRNGLPIPQDRFFSRITSSGTQTLIDEFNRTFVVTYSGYGIVSRDSFVFTWIGRDVSSTLQRHITCSEGPGGPGVCSPEYPITIDLAPVGVGTTNIFSYKDSWGSSEFPDPSMVSTNGYITHTLSDEYTTSDLTTKGATKISSASWGAWMAVAGSASRNLSTDEISYAVAEAQYRFRFKVPKVGSGTKYIIKWVERFSPEGGGAPTDTVKTFTWSGTIPGGYDATDSSTWPLSDEYTMAIPATDGTVALACITATCFGTAPADPCNP